MLGNSIMPKVILIIFLFSFFVPHRRKNFLYPVFLLSRNLIKGSSTKPFKRFCIFFSCTLGFIILVIPIIMFLLQYTYFIISSVIYFKVMFCIYQTHLKTVQSFVHSIDTLWLIQV